MKTPTKRATRRLAASLAIAIAFGISLKAAAFSVCAVGDSITRGASNFTAHRVALENEFDALGWIVEWKGTVSNASYGSINPCEGYSSKNAEYIAGQYESHATSVAADVLLLHAGHNYNADPATSSPAYLPEADIIAAVTNAHARIIAAARTQNPNVVVLYAKVITSSLDKYSYIPALNTAIGALGAELNTDASPVVVVDMADGWDPSTDCVSDGVHPTATGAAKMAKKWMAAINAQHAAGNIATARNITTDTTLSSSLEYNSLTVSPNATLNLNGHKLTTGGVSGGGTIMSAVFDDSETPCKSGYELLEYVQTPASNTGYIDTGYTPNCTDRVETKVSVGSTSGNEMVFSSRKAASGTASSCHLSCLKNGSKFRFDRCGKTGHANSGTITADTPYEIIADFGDLRYLVNGGSPLSATAETQTFTTDKNIILFATGNDYTLPASLCKMYYFRVFDKDGNLQVNMLPARKGGTAGFFDTVRKRFFTLSSGVLAAGGNISYEVLSYVKTPDDNNSDVNNVDTGYKPLLTDRVETKIRLGAVSSTQGIFTARETTAKNTFSCIFEAVSAGKRLRFDHNTSSPYIYHRAEGADSDTAYTTGEDYEIMMDGSTCAFSVNGEVSSTTLTANPAAASATPGITFRLFTIATKGSGTSSYAKGCRMYYFRVTDTNGYQRLNLIPARRTSDGKVGFYDTVHNAFITKADGESLEAGGTLLRDLTTSGGTCAMVPSPVYQGSVANLFNDNFTYALDASHRVLVNTSSTALPIRIDYDFGEGNEVAVNMYRIYAGYNLRSPKKWTLYGSNDAGAFNAAADDLWTELDSRDSQTDWTLGALSGSNTLPAECRTKAFANDAPYRYYRLKIEKRNDETQSWFELVQLEYFRVEPTVNPGELHIDVAEGDTVTNSGVWLGGDLKVVKEGAGDFVADAPGSFYTGGTDVKAGGFTLGAPLSTSLTLAGDATLGFLFHDRNTAPILTLGAASSIPSPLNVAIYRDGTFTLPIDGVTLTSSYNFGDTTVNFTSSDYARRVKKKDGNLVVSGPAGLTILFW